jgi:ADP-heptose:LPS heptosyltransferase
LGGAVVVVGGPEDAAAGQQVANACGDRAMSLAGRLSLRQVSALLQRCSVFVGNDSGPMHLAGAAGVPVVEVSCHPLSAPIDHPNSPARFGPWGVSARIVRPARHRRPCSNGCRSPWAHCILGVRVEDVVPAVADLWSETHAA